MKKLLIFILCCLLAQSRLMAQLTVPVATNCPIVFTVSWVNPKPMGNKPNKSPVQPPTVYLDDYVLTFEADHPDYTLYIKDEDGEVVYSSTVYSSQTQVTLPSSLSGDYDIELVMGNWMFTGWITL